LAHVVLCYTADKKVNILSMSKLSPSIIGEKHVFGGLVIAVMLNVVILLLLLQLLPLPLIPLPLLPLPLLPLPLLLLE
jgi:hypothetical protein